MSESFSHDAGGVWPNKTGERSPGTRLQTIAMRRLLGEPDTVVADYDLRVEQEIIAETMIFKTMDSPNRLMHINLIINARGGLGNYMGVGWWNEATGCTGIALFDDSYTASLPYFSLYNGVPLTTDQVQRWREQGAESFDRESQELVATPPETLLEVVTALESPNAQKNEAMTEAMFLYYESVYGAHRY